MELHQNANREIYEAKLKGVPVKRLAEQYGISEGSVRTVCNKKEQKERLKDERYYQILVSLIDNEETLTRAINVIERNGFGSKEALLKVTKKRLLQCRNCGQTTADWILQVAEILRNEM